MSDPGIQIGAPGLDVERIVEQIREQVARKRAEGAYDDPDIARAERHNLLNLKDDDEFLQRYLACLRQTVMVDINDFEIVERRARFSHLLVALKRTLWKLLRFYTFRLWSQQNQVNNMLLAALDVTESRFRDRVRKLEARIAELEAQHAPPPDA